MWPLMSDRPERPDTPSPAQAGEVTPENPRTPRPWRPPPAPRQSRLRGFSRSLSLRYVATTVLVGLLVLSTLWVGRNSEPPVTGFGVLDANGRVVETTAGSLTVGQHAPNFRLIDTDENVVELADFRGEPVVLQFWTSWCLDCVDAIPIFQQVATTYPDTVTVLGVAPGESEGRVSGALDRAGATYTTLLDETEVVSEHYGALPPPLTVVVNGAGSVAAIHAGRVSFEQLEADLAPLLP